MIFTSIMNATKYGEIQPAFCFSSKESFLMVTDYKDNDPKHTSKYIQRFYDNIRVNCWKSPTESLDLNPIELVWGSMKAFLRDKQKPKNDRTQKK